MSTAGEGIHKQDAVFLGNGISFSLERGMGRWLERERSWQPTGLANVRTRVQISRVQVLMARGPKDLLRGQENPFHSQEDGNSDSGIPVTRWASLQLDAHNLSNEG